MFGHTLKENGYKGMTEEEYKKLKYYLSYCIELSEGKLSDILAIYEKGILKVTGIAHNRVACKFSSLGYFNEDKMSLLIITTIYLPNNEEVYSTDTFAFLGDTITVTSHTDSLGDNVIGIPYFRNMFIR